jgi:divalent metal cation (Fe/Co/Zn/Cd) transporter
VVGFLITSATIIAYESILNIRIAHDSPKPWTLLVLGAIIIWKEYSFRLVMRRSVETNSSSLKDAWHHRSDNYFCCSFYWNFCGSIVRKRYESADDWAALFASGFILFNAYLILDQHLVK